MNIFAIDDSPEISAQNLHDRHIVKMILESCQLLSTVQRLSGNTDPCLYKITHQHHPCVKWLLESVENYQWLYRHYIALCTEYTYRYFKTHRCVGLINALKEPPNNLPNIPRTSFKQAMPDEYKTDDSIQAYRLYYLGHKIQNNFWTNRTKDDLLEWLSIKLKPSQFKQSKRIINDLRN